MTNPRLATRYAKSLMDLALEKNQLEAVYADMLALQQICSGNKDFVGVLKSPIINPGVKQKIVAAVTEGKTGALVNGFNHLIIAKGREAGLPEIVNTFIEQYKAYKGIKTVTLTTASPVDESVKKSIIDKVHEAGTTVELISVVDEKIIGGFVLQTGDNLIDASIAYDLNEIRKQFLNNDFIYKIR